MNDLHKKIKQTTKHIYQDKINGLSFNGKETISLEELKSVFNIAMISTQNYNTY